MEERQLQAAVHKALLSVGLKEQQGVVYGICRGIATSPWDDSSVRKAIGDGLKKYPVSMRRGIPVADLTDVILEAVRPILPYLDASANLLVSIDDIDSFEEVRRVQVDDVRGEVPVGTSEDEIQITIEAFVGELSHKKDWPGEYADLVSGHLLYRGHRRMLVAALKGPAKKYPLQIKDYGVNGDQIERLFQVDADFYLIQGCGPFAETFINHAAGLAGGRARGDRWLRYCLMDGTDTARILRASQFRHQT